MAKTTSKPEPAPSTASETARQLASLARRTGRSRARARSSANGRPLRKVELALRIRPVRGEIEPGMAKPMRSQRPVRASVSATRAQTVPIAAS